MSISVSGTPLPGSYMRTRPVPVDTTSVWATYAKASEYADNNGTDNYCPYDGQLVVTLEGYPDVSPSSPKYTEAHLWRLKYNGTTPVGGLQRQHFTLDEVKSGDAVAGTDVHNIYTGTQRFGSWIELLAGMTMGFNLAVGYENGEPVVLTDDVTGQVKKLDEHGTPVTISDNDERIWLDSQGHAHMVISAIKVLGKMEVHEIDVNHIKHTGGLFVNSRANLVVSDVTEQTGGYTKLSFVQRNADGMAIYNLFEAGDLALSMTFNVVKEGASQPTGDEVVRFYWREVDSIGTDSQSGTGYIILKPVPSAYQSYMSTPQVGDSVVQVGHVDAPSGSDETTVNHAKSRQGLQCMGFSHTNGPYIAEYYGINSVAASVNFDDYDNAIVYLSPKKHKLQGDVIKLKAGQGGTDVEMTANSISTMASNIETNADNIETHANVLDLYTDEELNVHSGAIEAKADTVTVEAKELALQTEMDANNKWTLKMTKDTAGIYLINNRGEAVNMGQMALVRNAQGQIGAVIVADSGEMTYTEDFKLKASQINFESGSINLNTAKFIVGNDEIEGLLEIDAQTNKAYIRTSLLNVNELETGIVSAINSGQLKINATKIQFNDGKTGAELIDGKFIIDTNGNVTLNNLTVGGDSVFNGIVKAGMMYGTTIDITPLVSSLGVWGSTDIKVYDITPSTAPAKDYIYRGTNKLIVTLPDASTYDGVEFGFYGFSVTDGFQNTDSYIVYSDQRMTGFRKTSTGRRYAVTSDAVWVDVEGTKIKAIGGAWYILRGNGGQIDSGEFNYWGKI